jgi:hypothetical protein
VDRITCERPESLYLTQWRIFHQLPSLLQDVDLEDPGLPHPVLATPPTCYIGPAMAFTPIHFDYAPSLTAQVQGRKRWTLFPPDDKANLYKYPWPGALSHFSRVNSFEKLSDFAAFPRLRCTRPIEAVVEEGQMIYVPEGWWHHVEVLEPSISLHFSWKTWPLFARQLALAPLDRLMRRRRASKIDPRMVVRRLMARARELRPRLRPT